MGGWGPLQEDAVVGCTHRPAEPRGLQTPLAPRPQRSPHRQPGWARMRERPGLPPTDDAKWPYPAGNRRTRRGPATGTSPQSAAPGSARARGRTRPGLLYARVAAHAPSRPHARSSSGGPRLARAPVAGEHLGRHPGRATSRAGGRCPAGTAAGTWPRLRLSTRLDPARACRRDRLPIAAVTRA